MTTQSIAFLSWLVSGIVIALGFTWVGWRSRRALNTSAQQVNRFRMGLFLFLLVASIFFLGYTLPKVPYPTDTVTPDRVVFVAAKQFSFAISEKPVSTEKEWEEVTQYGELVEVPVGALVEFRVTSLDVNHGFSIYDPDGLLLGQVQAMPGYVNRLRFRFSKPGTYTTLCLEYCGNSHHTMKGAFTVQ